MPPPTGRGCQRTAAPPPSWFVAQHALDHGGDLRGGAAPQTRVDAHRAALHVPVDHDAAPAVASVPLGHEVLVEGAKVLAVRCAGRSALAPDLGLARSERRVDHVPGRIAQRVGIDVTPARVQQLLVAEAVPADGEPLEAARPPLLRRDVYLNAAAETYTA